MPAILSISVRASMIDPADIQAFDANRSGDFPG
jgi:hypothetical protein